MQTTLTTITFRLQENRHDPDEYTIAIQEQVTITFKGTWLVTAPMGGPWIGRGTTRAGAIVDWLRQRVGG